MLFIGIYNDLYDYIMLDLFIINLKSDSMYLEKQHLDDIFIGYIPDILNGSKLDHHFKLSLQIFHPDDSYILKRWWHGGVWFSLISLMISS